MLEHALELVEHLGLAVFPVARDCKPGRLPWAGTAKGFLAVHDATRDPELVAAYWAAHPGANISVACGAPSGIFVLDVDVKDSAGQGFDGLADLEMLQALHGRLPITWRSRTPSGGEHWWFRQPARELTNRVHMRVADGHGGEVKTGLDVRTDGGAAPAPPSAKPNGPYVWLDSPWETPFSDAPAWLLDIIDPPLPPPTPRQPIRVTSWDRTARYVAGAIDRECREVARMAARSGRNLRLFQAAANLGEFIGAGVLTVDGAAGPLEHAAQDCGLWAEDGPHACRATIASGLKKGMQRPREVTR